MAWHHYTRKQLEDLDDYLLAREVDPRIRPIPTYFIGRFRKAIGLLIEALRKYQVARFHEPD